MRSADLARNVVHVQRMSRRRGSGECSPDHSNMIEDDAMCRGAVRVERDWICRLRIERGGQHDQLPPRLEWIRAGRIERHGGAAHKTKWRLRRRESVSIDVELADRAVVVHLIHVEYGVVRFF